MNLLAYPIHFAKPWRPMRTCHIDGLVERILRGHHAKRATIRRVWSHWQHGPHHQVVLGVLRDECTLGCQEQAVRREGQLLPHYEESSVTQDSPGHRSGSLTDLGLSPDFANPYLCDFGRIADCLTKPAAFLICYVRLPHWVDHSDPLLFQYWALKGTHGEKMKSETSQEGFNRNIEKPGDIEN